MSRDVIDVQMSRDVIDNYILVLSCPLLPYYCCDILSRYFIFILNWWVWPYEWVSVWVIVVKHQFSNLSAISWWREQVNFQWDDDEVHFVFSLNIFHLLKCAKRIRHKLNKLMKSSPIYNKLQHYLIEHACI